VKTKFENHFFNVLLTVCFFERKQPNAKSSKAKAFQVKPLQTLCWSGNHIFAFSLVR